MNLEKICEKIIGFGDFMWDATKTLVLLLIAAGYLVGAPVAVVYATVKIGIYGTESIFVKMFFATFGFVTLIPWAHLVCSFYLEVVKGRN